ncbi:vWA domain-containing protein [Thermomonospora amylolytica]|uniref:vWA domain-containing protein n=1 Tax=Thermomonospora amylolytica TaxID=1411117 RepID=UPI000E6D557C|nr:substrate-binding domain-containing protein [Thermomonospora amylolytica]
MDQTIFIVDVQGFSSPERTADDQEEIRRGLERALRTAFADSGLDWDACHYEDRGDGCLMVLPHEHRERLISPLPGHLARELREHNARHRPEAQIRLRAAVHFGDVRRDDRGYSGQAIITTRRMVDAEELKTALDGSSSPLAVIVSDWTFENVVRKSPDHHHHDYRWVTVSPKSGEPIGAWIRLPAPLRRSAPPSTRTFARMPSVGTFARMPSARSAAALGAVLFLVLTLTAGGDALPGGCPRPPAEIRVLASAEKERVIRTVARDFEQVSRDAGGCPTVHVRVASVPFAGAVDASLDQGWLDGEQGEVSAEADVWLPDSGLEVARLRRLLEDGRAPGISVHSLGSVARSVVVAAVPRQMADALGLDGGAYRWEDMPDWPQRHPGGAFFARPSPRSSSVGLAATVALYRATLHVGALTAETLGEAGAPERLHAVEHIMTQGDEDPMRLLCALRNAPPDSELRRTAFLISEKTVLDYRSQESLADRCGPSSIAPELVPLYAEGGAPLLDHPFVVIDRTELPRSPARSVAVEEFYRYLLGDQAQQRLRQAGYRDTAGVGSGQDPLVPYRPAVREQYGLFDDPALLDAWDRVRRSARVLLAIDQSRTMSEPFPYHKGTRLAAAVDALGLSLRLVGARDEIGLLGFAAGLDGGRDHRLLLPLGRPAAGHRGDMDRALRGLRVLDAAPALHDAIGAAVDRLRADDGDPDTTDAVIAIADGTDPDGPSTAALADRLAAGDPVRVFVIAFRAGGCTAGLDEVTRDSGGECYEVDGMTGMRRALDGIAAGLWGVPRP